MFKVLKLPPPPLILCFSDIFVSFEGYNKLVISPVSWAGKFLSITLCLCLFAIQIFWFMGHIFYTYRNEKDCD